MGTQPVLPTAPALSHAAAIKGGQAMYDRWMVMCPGESELEPPFERHDAAWADMFRAGYEAVRWP